MADIIIPPPDAAGYWHFTYVTTDTLTGEWYGGKRSCRKHPLSDRYKGSGNWIKAHPARERLTREIVAFHTSAAEALASEAEMITCAVVMGDALCMNLREGGRGVSPQSHLNPAFRAIHSAAMIKRSANTEWRENHAAGIAKRASDPVWRENVAASNRRMASDPEWLEATAARNQRLAHDLEWLEANAAKMRRLHADPTFRAAHLAGMKRRNADPAWQASHAAGQRRRWAAWRAAKAAGGK